MIVLSFDIGIKNLAYGLFDIQETRWMVLDWDILSLVESDELCKKVGLAELCARLIERLDDTFDARSTIDLVLLENQPVMKNPVMKSIQMMVYTYFNIRRAHESNVGEVRLVSARTKNVWASAKALLSEEEASKIDALQSDYQKNKKQSVAVVKILLQAGCIDCPQDRKDRFEKSKKKDDLADALLQAWAVLHPSK